MKTATSTPPRWMREGEWREFIRVGKTKSFALIKSGRVVTKKVDGVLLIDVPASLANLDLIAA